MMDANEVGDESLRSDAAVPHGKRCIGSPVRTRWPKGVRCLACNHGKCWQTESTNKTGGPRRLFQCASCKYQFSATTGTLFHDSHLPLTKWFAAVSLMSDAKKGISASQLGRHIGMTYKTAWYVAHRIREAMREAKDIQLGDPDTTVEIDEAYIGGGLRHHGSKVAQASKTMVIGMAERNGRVHLESMSNRRLESIQPVLDAKLAEDTKEVVTDGNPTYLRLIPEQKHSRGNHGKELADRVWTTTQTVENAFSLFKRAIVGNYHKLSPWHLDRYMREFCWRYNRRRMQASIFEMALTSMVTRSPLPYKTLVAF
jgi:transposase-like protein